MKKANTTTTKRTKVNKIKVDGGFELVDNIAIPEDTGRKGIKSPFRKTVEAMSIGQSFETDYVPKHRYSIEKKLGVKLAIKKLDNGNSRVWRKS